MARAWIDLDLNLIEFYIESYRLKQGFKCVTQEKLNEIFLKDDAFQVHLVYDRLLIHPGFT